MKLLKRVALSMIQTILLVYLGIMLLISIFQTRLIFFPTAEIATTPDTYGYQYEDLNLPVGDHTTHTWFIPAADPERGTILFSHGNAGNMSDRLESIKIFHQLGYNTLIYDYGGYGNSTGTPSESRCYADIQAQWEYLTQTREIPPDQIILFGRSLGGGVTAELATQVTPAAIILESTFSSIPDMARQQFRIFPTKLLVKHKFNTLSKLDKFTAPILHIHSETDELIPYTHGQALHDSSPQPKQLLTIRGGHNEGYLITQSYPEDLDAFLNKHIGTTPEQ